MINYDGLSIIVCHSLQSTIKLVTMLCNSNWTNPCRNPYWTRIYTNLSFLVSLFLVLSLCLYFFIHISSFLSLPPSLSLVLTLPLYLSLLSPSLSLPLLYTHTHTHTHIDSLMFRVLFARLSRELRIYKIEKVAKISPVRGFPDVQWCSHVPACVQPPHTFKNSITEFPDFFVILRRKLEKIRPNCIISEHLHVDRSAVWNQYLLCRLLRTGGSVNMPQQQSTKRCSKSPPTFFLLVLALFLHLSF